MSKSNKLHSFTDEEFKAKVHPFNQQISQEFIEQAHLSPQTLKQYKNATNIFFKFVYEHCMNKPLYEMRSRDALKFQNFLIKAGLSSSAVKLKRSVVSSLCGYFELYYGDEEEYKNFRNIFTKAIPNIAHERKKEKIPLTTEEIETILVELEKRKEWQKIAYVLFCFSSGCRKAEVRQLLKEVISYEKHKDNDGNEKNFYNTHNLRTKGRGSLGKVRRLVFDERAMNAIKKWIDIRQDLVEIDDCPYVFVSKSNGKFKQVSPNTFNLWCSEFSQYIGGKAVFPHLIRSSIATELKNKGKDIKSIQALLGHQNSSTTEIYIVEDESNVLDDIF